MSEPFTREKCGICGKQFEIPMERRLRLMLDTNVFIR